MLEELPDRGLAAMDDSQVGGRLRQPKREQAGAGWGRGPVDCLQQGRLARTIGGGEQLEVARRGRIQEDRCPKLCLDEAEEVLGPVAERIGDVAEHGTSGSEGRMLVGEAEAREAMHGKRLGDQARPGGYFEVPAREAGDRPALHEDFKRLAELGRRFEPFGQNHFPRRHRMQERQEAMRVGIRGEAEIRGRHVEPGGMPAVLVPGERSQVIAATRVELRVLERRARRQDAREAAADELAGDRGFELVADGDLPAGREQAVDVSRRRMVRQPGHRRLVAFRQREPEHLGRDLSVFAEDLIEVPESEEQNRPGRELLTELAVLTLHGGLLGHARSESPPTASARMDCVPLGVP